MSDDKNFVFLQGRESQEFAIKLLDPRFDDIVVSFGKVGINESDDKNHASLAFDYNILQGDLPCSIEGVTEFENQLGDALVFILENHFDEGEVVSADD